MKQCMSITYKNENNKKQLVLLALLLFFGYAAISYIIPKVNIKHHEARYHESSTSGNIQHQTDIIKNNSLHSNFLKDWSEINSRKYDFGRLEKDCGANFKWRKEEAIPWHNQRNRTSLTRGFISQWNINRVGEFSTIILQTQRPNGNLKTIGGDHWRVRVNGASSPYVTKTDLRNGSYEFKFLPVLPGTYQIFIWLEYTLCTGLKEPPSDWFIKGTIQGKEQKQGSLHRDIPFINKPLWSGTQINFVVPESTSKDLLPNNACSNVQATCKLLWNGFGSWVNETNWLPFCPSSTELRYPRNVNHQKVKKGVLWFFGDSVSTQFYHQVKLNRLCKTLFSRCMYTYNWLYTLENYNATLGRYVRRNTTIEKTIWNDDDYNADQIVDELRQVLLHPAMTTNKSVLLLNYGLHFTESLNYTNFKLTIRKIVQLLRSEARCQVIWRTTTSLNRHKYSQPNLHSRRFMTSPRVELYNAYATHEFCRHQFDVMDIYPLTDSYPKGTGSKKTPHDPVHYEYHVMKPMEQLLERVFAPH